MTKKTIEVYKSLGSYQMSKKLAMPISYVLNKNLENY